MKKIIAMLALAVLAVCSFVMADPTLDISAQVNGMSVTSGKTMYLERGDTVDVEVEFKSSEDMDDTRVKVWVGGYEYDDVGVRSDIFDLEANITHRQVLSFELPDDMDASEKYTLNIEVYNSNFDDKLKAYLKIEESRHMLRIIDLVVRPENQVSAGSSLFANVRVENLGDKKEEDIRVDISVPALGISQRVYIDELTGHEIDNEDEEDSMSSDDVYLRIPVDAEAGIYQVKAEVYYNKGHDMVTTSRNIEVVSDSVSSAADTIISLDSESKRLPVGQEGTFRVMIANMGSKANVYSVELAGEKTWAVSNVEPAFVSVQKDGTGEVVVKLTPMEDSEGQHTFTIKLKQGDLVVAEKNIFVQVEEGQGMSVGKKALVIGLVVILALIVIVALIVMFGRMREDEDDDELGAGEGQAYYYNYY